MKTHVIILKKMEACGEAVDFAKNYETLDGAWQACERGDWMLWLLGKLSGEPESEARKKLVLACCECARLAMEYVPKDELKPLEAIETAERWAKGEATIAAVKDAANAAANAAYAANAANAAYAAYAANAAAYAANAANAKNKTLKKCADIVRKYYPQAPEVVL